MQGDSPYRLKLLPGKEKSLQRRHPWIFSGAFSTKPHDIPEGELVDVYTADNRWMAVGQYQQGSIMVKVLSFDEPHVDMGRYPDFWRQRVASAVALRQQLGLVGNEQTNVFRLINGEGDFLPSLIVDYYAGTLVLQAHSVGMYRLFPALVPMLMELVPGAKAVFSKSSATLPEGVATDGFLHGAEVRECEVCEHGNRMLVDLYDGQKTGFFIDQRDNRALVGRVAAGRRVLNCFGYTGGFSLSALAGGASYVETVDISRKALTMCDRNIALNHFEQSHRSVAADVLKYLDEVGDDFDIVILDPPAFAKNHHSLQQGLKGYRSINQKAMRQLRAGGLLFTFSCSQAVSREDFQTMAFSAAALAGRQVRVVRYLSQAEDHPVSIYHPEGAYLKGLLLEVE